MANLHESEKIIAFDYVNIKPIGINAAAGRGSSDSGGLNKGHIVNAGVMYLLESGQLKVVSTTGSLLAEKNIALDVSPAGGNLQDAISSVVTGLNPEDMRISVLTKSGHVFVYPIILEKPFDPSDFQETLLDNNTTSLNQT